MRKRILQISRWFILTTVEKAGTVSIFALLSAILVYSTFVCCSKITPTASAWWSALAAISGSLAASTIWFAFAFIYVRDYLLGIREFARLDDVPLEKYIRESTCIEVNVHGWDGLLLGPGGTIAEPLKYPRALAWQDFFLKKKGTLVLVMPKISRDTTSREYQTLLLIKDRTAKTIDKQIEEIENTTKAAYLIAGGNGRIDARDCTHLRWICTILFDNRRLLISPYTAQSEKAKFDGPAFVIDLRRYELTKTWIEKLHSRDESDQNDPIPQTGPPKSRSKTKRAT